MKTLLKISTLILLSSILAFSQESPNFHDLGAGQLLYKKVVFGQLNGSNMSTPVKYLEGTDITIRKKDKSYYKIDVIMNTNSLDEHLSTSYLVTHHSEDSTILSVKEITIYKDGTIDKWVEEETIQYAL